MAESTKISWTNSTFNPWWGCSQISPGCSRCYAKAFDHRLGGNFWEPGVSPRPMSDGYWKKPKGWNRRAEKEGRRARVFSGSMCDIFDVNGIQKERDRLWTLISETPSLDWLLLTKRANRIREYLPEDWGKGYPNVWLGVSVEDRAHGIPRIFDLWKVPAAVRFLSIEPLLEDLGAIPFLDNMDWVIVGGESGTNARPVQPRWVKSIIRQCQDKRIPVFFKQWGGSHGNGACLFDGQEIKEWPSVMC